MTKIKKISIHNYKAVSRMEADFKGCTAIITGGNNTGKTSFLRGIPDRIRGEKPDIIVKSGEKNGRGELELTTGERFEWEFGIDGKDKLTFISKDGIKNNISANIRTGTAKEICERFFPPVFDIDKFLNAQPKEQSKMLQQLAGVDFTEIEMQYKSAFDERALANRMVKEQEARTLTYDKNLPEELIDVSAMEQELGKIGGHNQLYEQAKERHEENKQGINSTIADIKELEKKLQEAKQRLGELEVKAEKGEAWLNDETNQPKEAASLQEKITAAKQENEKRNANLKAKEAAELLEKKKQEAEQADLGVKEIDEAKKKLIAGAKFPEGIALSDDGVTVDGLPLDRKQISLSKIYTTALKLGSMRLGKVKTLYFDASPLDKNTLSEIEAWAKENDLQLLIEKPDYEGGEIRYELTETP